MLKKIISILTMTTVSLLVFHSNVLAEKAKTYIYSDTLYPDTCNISTGSDYYKCDYVIVGIFASGSGNIKLCDQEDCLILILDSDEFKALANGEKFYVTEIAWQNIINKTPIKRLSGSLYCTSTSTGLICFGSVNGGAIAIYAD